MENQQKLNELITHIERLQGGAYRRLHWSDLRTIAMQMLSDSTFTTARFTKDLHLARARLFSSLEDAESSVTEVKDMLWPEDYMITSYSRCAPPKVPVLYATDNFDTALSEIRPVVGQFVCVGHIHTTEPVYAVALGEIDRCRRTGSTRFQSSMEYAKKAYSDGDTAALVLDAFLSDIMSTPSNHQADYKLSSAFCDAIWNPPDMVIGDGLRTSDFASPSGFTTRDLVSALSYPSVAHGGGNNFAFKPEVYKKRLSLTKCAIWRILEDYSFGIYRKELVAESEIASSGSITWNRVKPT